MINLRYLYLLIKAVRGRLSFRFPLPAKLIPIPGCHSVFCQYLLSTLSFSFPLHANLILIPTCIPHLAKIKLKNTNMVPLGFEPATS
jgi:hypothetical protein